MITLKIGKKDFWHIYDGKNRVGKVYIKTIEGKPYINMFINKGQHGKGIGRIALKKACKQSRYRRIYATTRKGNAASTKAAKAAGFKEIPSARQRQMVWVRR
jgi:RimJ/RimL family protein N-acetyltransferase